VVFWTRYSVQSDFVRDEARAAYDAGKLIPVRLEDVKPPLGFRGVHGLDLFDSPPQSSHKSASWNAFMKALVNRIAEHVKSRLTVQLDGGESRERELALYFTRSRNLSVVCGRAASAAVPPFYWGLAMLGFTPSRESEPEDGPNGGDLLPIFQAIAEAELVLFALYPPTMSGWSSNAALSVPKTRLASCFSAV
jgi:hypothetical protein